MRHSVADDAIAQGQRPKVLVTIAGPVETLRLASEPLAVEDGDTGVVYRYDAGLMRGVDLSDEVDLFALTGTVALQTAQLVIVPAGLDIATEEEAEYGLMAASVEVALWWEGMTWAQRVVVLDAGRVSKLTTGREGEPSEIWLDSVGPAAGESSVEAARDIGTDFPSLGFTSLAGRLWPQIVGVVYKAPAFKLGVQSSGKLDLGLCGHALAPDVVVGDLAFYEDGAATSPTSPTLYEGEDSTGTFAYVRITDTGAAVDAFDLGTGAYTVDYTRGAVACARNPGRAARSAGEVLEWLLDRSGERVDWTAQAACTRALADLEIGIIRDSVTGELDVIRRRLVPLLPILERRSRDGIYFLHADPWHADPVAHLTLGQELVGRLGPPTYTDLDAVRNVVTVEYAWDGFSGLYTERVTVGATELEACRYSQQLWGVQTADTIRADITASERTARRIGELAMLRLALPRRRFSYVAHPSLYWLTAGSVVLLTDDEYGVSARRAVVRRVHPTLAPPTMELEVLAAPPAGRL